MFSALQGGLMTHSHDESCFCSTAYDPAQKGGVEDQGDEEAHDASGRDRDHIQ